MAVRRINALLIVTASKQKKDVTCSLPPVTTSRTGKHKTCSAGAQLQQRSPDELKQTKKSKIRQSSAQVTKQYQAKPIQNFTFNQPGNIFLQNCKKAQSKDVI